MKDRDHKQIVLEGELEIRENDYITFDDFIIPYYGIGIKPPETILG